MLVYVLNKHGKPLMPCNSRKARLLLKAGNAKVVRVKPFTIRMVHGSSAYIQPVNLGVDAGSKVVGISATTDKKELYSSECKLRTDVTDNLSTRRAFRRARRNRTTRYRPPRFLNRRKSKKKGWLAPSIIQKINTHEQIIKQVHNILPISKIIVEVAAFDIQKIKNPSIINTEYQQGEQLDFWNVREYVLFRDNHSCQHCKGKSKDKILNVHHIESRKTGGNAPNNLITLCETCHNKHHAQQIKLKVKRGASFRDAAFTCPSDRRVSVMRWAFYNKLKEQYPNVSMTYGYLTKNTRISNKLEKSHAVDARCISGNPMAKPSENTYTQKAVRTKNRQLHKATTNKGGSRKSNQAAKYVFGYQLFDNVRYKEQECFIFGRRTSGYFDLRLLNGVKIHASASYKQLELLQKSRTILTERGMAIPPTS